jgi:hypothetical protein
MLGSEGVLSRLSVGIDGAYCPSGKLKCSIPHLEMAPRNNLLAVELE